jgi:hypothetical protein
MMTLNLGNCYYDLIKNLSLSSYEENKVYRTINLPVILNANVIWSLRLWEEHKVGALK